MKHVLKVELPEEALEQAAQVAQKALGQPGVAVPVSRGTLDHIDTLLQKTLSETLQVVRERERAPASESLKMRVW